MEVVRKVGLENMTAPDSLAASVDRMASSTGRMAESESQKETRGMIAESVGRMSESQNAIAKLLERALKNSAARRADLPDRGGPASAHPRARRAPGRAVS